MQRNFQGSAVVRCCRQASERFGWIGVESDTLKRFRGQHEISAYQHAGQQRPRYTTTQYR